VGEVDSALERVTDEQWARAAAHRVDAPVSIDAVAGSQRGSKRSRRPPTCRTSTRRATGVHRGPDHRDLRRGSRRTRTWLPVPHPAVDLRFEWEPDPRPVETFRTTLACARGARRSGAGLEIDLPVRVVAATRGCPRRWGPGPSCASARSSACSRASRP
jgi:hypothetical protein